MSTARSNIPWTRFMDMHSGGGTKEGNYEKIYIQAPQTEAEVIFFNRFGHSPNRVSCTCCGEDYSISEEESLEQASGYDRGCEYAYMDPDGNEVTQKQAWVAGRGMRKGYSSAYVERQASGLSFINKYCTLDEYRKLKSVLVIPDSDIKPTERIGSVPEQGYIWVD
jgi:hypothetical protein